MENVFARRQEVFMEDVFIRQEELSKVLKVSVPTLLRWERAGTFPLRRQLGPQRIAWLISEIEAWVRDRPVAVRDLNGGAGT